MSSSELSFGNNLRSQFLLDSKDIHLNTSEFGCTSNAILDQKLKEYESFEKNPDHYYRVYHQEHIQKSREYVSKRFNITKDLAFLETVSEALLSVLKSLSPQLNKNQILLFDFTANHIKNACSWAANQYDSTLVQIKTNEKIIQTQEEILLAFVEALEENKNVRFVVLEHVSELSMILPVKEIIEVCKNSKIPIFLDGSNVVGQIPYKSQEVQGDFNTLSFDKWHFGGKCCTAFWVKEEWQDKIHPVNVSYLNQGDFTKRFGVLATRDYSSVYILEDSFKLIDSLGVEKSYEYIHNLAKESSQVAKEYKLEPLLDDQKQYGGYLTIRLSFNEEKSKALEEELATKHQIFVKVIEFNKKYYLRICCQIFNEISEIKKVFDTLTKM